MVRLFGGRSPLTRMFSARHAGRGVLARAALAGLLVAGSTGVYALASVSVPLPAVQSATALATTPTLDSVPLEFDAQPVPVTLPAKELPVDIHCSRACDLDIKLVARQGGDTRTVAIYHETEEQIPEPFSRIELKLPGSVANASTRVRLALKFVATDAEGDVQRLRRALTLYPG
jgi:hypothetical protein